MHWVFHFSFFLFFFYKEMNIRGRELEELFDLKEERRLEGEGEAEEW